MTSERWTHKQHALLLNYVDACLLDNMNYTDTVQQALLNATGREATLSAIMYRLRQYVKLCNPPMIVKDFLSRGTHSLDKGAISEDLLNTMRQQRSPRLHDLQLRDSPKFNATLDAESRLSGENERRPRNAPKSYLESSIPDSPASNRNLEDDDYVERMRGMDSPVRNPSIARRTSENQKNTQKRKATTSEVTDLVDGTDAPLPKRRALDKASSAILEPAETHALSLADDLRIGSSQVDTVNQDQGPTASQSVRVPSEEPHSPPALNDAQAESLSQTPSESDSNSTTTQGSSNVPRSKKPILQINVSSSTKESRPSPQAQGDQKRIQEQLNAQGYLLTFMAKKMLKAEHLLDEGVLEALKTLSDGTDKTSANSAKKLVQSANPYRATQDNMRATLKAVFGRQELGTDLEFPPVPSVQEVDRAWRAARKGLKEAFTDEYTFPVNGPVLRDTTAGYIAATVDHLLSDPKAVKQIECRLEGHLESPHAAQAVISAVFCRWLFKTPSAMCKVGCNDLQLSMYNAVSLADGLAEVQRLDKIAFSSFFKDPNFQTTTLQTEITKLNKVFDKIKRMCPAAYGIQNVDDPKAWAEAVLTLKQRLMISPHDYRVHFCHPEEPFDSSWMTAENEEGDIVPPAQVMSMTVRICLFPALLELEPEEFQEEQPTDAALIKNKRFLPSWDDRQAFDAKKVVAKAVVLVA